MKYIKSINEYLNPNKDTYIKWLNNKILSDIKSSNIDVRHVNDYSFSFYISSENNISSDIKKVMNILLKWKKYALENDNLVMMIKNNEFIDDNSAKFKLHYKLLKIKRVKPFRYVYHQTKKANLDSILLNGLLPYDSSEWVSDDWTLEYPPAIFANNMPELNNYDIFHKDKGDYVVLRIDTSKIKNKWFSDLNLTYDELIKKNKPSKYIMTFEPILPKALKLMKQ